MSLGTFGSRLKNEDYKWWVEKWEEFTDLLLSDDEMMAEYEESLEKQRPDNHDWWAFDDVSNDTLYNIYNDKHVVMHVYI